MAGGRAATWPQKRLMSPGARLRHNQPMPPTVAIDQPRAVAFDILQAVLRQRLPLDDLEPALGFDPRWEPEDG